MVTVSMSFSNPNPVFKATAFLKSNLLRTVFLLDSNRKPYIIYRRYTTFSDPE